MKLDPNSAGQNPMPSFAIEAGCLAKELRVRILKLPRRTGVPMTRPKGRRSDLLADCWRAAPVIFFVSTYH